MGYCTQCGTEMVDGRPCTGCATAITGDDRPAGGDAANAGSVLPIRPATRDARVRGQPSLGGWGIAVFLFGWIGGLCGWAVLRKSDPDRGARVVKWGLIWTAIWLGFSIVMFVVLAVVANNAVSDLDAYSRADQSTELVDTPSSVAPAGSSMPGTDGAGDAGAVVDGSAGQGAVDAAPTVSDVPAVTTYEAARSRTDASLSAFRAGDFSEAETDARAALTYLEGSGLAYEGNALYNLGAALLQQGRCTEALSYLERSAESGTAAQRKIRLGTLTRARQCG